MATEAEFWGRPAGSTGDAVKSVAERARLVREAMAAVADDASDRGEHASFVALRDAAELADDASLAKLGRMLK